MWPRSVTDDWIDSPVSDRPPDALPLDDDTLERTSPRLQVWTLRKDGRSATCHAQPHALGVEIFWDVDQEVQRTEVATTALAGQALADAWRDAFIGKGWMP